MNLSTTLSIFAGGEGSGCHGPNCGRPRGYGKHTPALANRIVNKLTDAIPNKQFYVVGSVGHGKTSKHDVDIAVRGGDFEEHETAAFEKVMNKLGFEFSDQQDYGEVWMSTDGMGRAVDFWFREPTEDERH